MRKISIPLILSLFLSVLAYGQKDTCLAQLLKIGLDNNSALKQKHLNYEKSILALRESRSLFFPELSINARYTISRGGRTIEFPAGDMLNPVYSTLNQITSQMYEFGLADEVFPDVKLDNEVIPFLREKEHDTKISLVQPIFNSSIYYNHKLKQQMSKVEQVGIELYEKTLMAEISSAYYSYRKSLAMSDLVDNVSALLLENLRVSESLLRNEKVTQDVVFRARSEIAKNEQQKAEAQKYSQMALAYLNFLLNRPLETPIIPPAETPELLLRQDLESSKNAALGNRKELTQIAKYKDVSDTYIKLNRGNMLPTVFAVADYGFQGEEYNFTKDDDYFMASFVFRWTLFKGFNNKAKIDMAIIDRKILEERESEAKRQISLEVSNAWYQLQAAEKSIIAAKAGEEAAEQAYRIIARKYKEGQANSIELLDGLTTYHIAAENYIISLYDYHIKNVEFNRVTAK